MNTPAQYQQLWDTMVNHKPIQTTVIVEQIQANRRRYESVITQGFTVAWKIPWYVVGVIHSMESSLNFNRHLHNGDPLTARTVRVPAGRPVKGNPPFTWEHSAVDALELRGLDKVSDWSVPHMLLCIEGYNGFGYQRRGINTPYLWAGSNQYTGGMYVSDGKYDPAAVSHEIGAALLLKQLAS